jgi:glycerol-3-phosphate acyltransferase PlsX
MKIAVDAMGGDNGSKPIIEAIKEFLKENKDVEIIAFGKEEELRELSSVCRVVNAPDIVPMEAGALEVLRMKNSSMCKAVSTMKEECFDAVISAGSTGGFLSAATLILKTIPGVKRSALVTAFPTKIKGKKVVVLDVGASNENSAEELVQFAYMGKAYNEALFGTKEPKTYLLSNGSEEHKGSPLVKEAHKMFLEDKFVGFQGNMEARDVLNGDCDVIVCDGFSGNVLLKGMEGIAKMMSGMIKANFKKNLWTKLGYLHVRKGFKDMSETMDYKSVGGAMLLGINGVVVKAHGNSDAYSFKNAMRVAHQMVEFNVINKIKESTNIFRQTRQF